MMKVAEATVKYLISKLGILVCWHNVWNKTKLWLGNLFSDTKAFEDGMEDFIGGDGAAGDFGKVEEHGTEVLAECLRWEFIEPTFNHSIKL